MSRQPNAAQRTFNAKLPGSNKNGLRRAQQVPTVVVATSLARRRAPRVDLLPGAWGDTFNDGDAA